MRWRQLRGLFQLRSSLSGSTTGTVRSSNNSKGIYLKHRQVRFTFLIKGYVKSCTKYNETCKIYTFNSYFHLPFNQHLDLFFKESAALYFSLQKCFNSLIFSQYCILCKYSTQQIQLERNVCVCHTYLHKFSSERTLFCDIPDCQANLETYLDNMLFCITTLHVTKILAI